MVNPIEPRSARHVARVGHAGAEPAMTLASQLMVARSLFGSFIETTLETAGLNSGEADVLMAVRVRDDEPVTPTDLVVQLAVSSPGMTKRLDALETKGLLRRESHPSDRRSLTLHLTTEGERLADQTIAAKADALLQLTGDAFVDDELPQINALLAKLIRALADTAS